MVGERFGWKEHLRPFLYKDLPPGTGWCATLGTLCALLAGVLAVTGVFLAMYYNPSPDKAYQSIGYIVQRVPLGALLRGIHHWGAGAMVLAVVVHMLANYFSGAYRRPREWTWIAGVCLLLVTLGLGFTGYLLPWDMKAYWATVVGSNIPKDVPAIGPFLTKLIRGGDTVSGLTLTRFYAIHMLLLPALLAGFTLVHLYLVRIHNLAAPERPEGAPIGAKITAPVGASFASGRGADTGVGPRGHPAEAHLGGVARIEEQARQECRAGRLKPASRRIASDSPQEPAKPYRFFPEHTFRSALVFTAVFLGIVTLAVLRQPRLEPIAGTQMATYLPRPEWYFMWLFQLLTLFSGRWESVGSIAIPAAATALLFAAPFLSKGRQRPVANAFGAAAVTGVVYLTLMGFAGAAPYGAVIPIPGRPLTASETRGLYLYADRECAYCHQIRGRGGHRTGPDLSNIGAKHRSRDYLARYIRNPQLQSAGSIMPKYNLPDGDLQALADFVLALDFRQYPMRIVTREEALRHE